MYMHAYAHIHTHTHKYIHPCYTHTHIYIHEHKEGETNGVEASGEAELGRRAVQQSARQRAAWVETAAVDRLGSRAGKDTGGFR